MAASDIAEGDRAQPTGPAPPRRGPVAPRTVSSRERDHSSDHSGKKPEGDERDDHALATRAGFRGRGLLAGIVLDRDAKDVVKRLRDHGILSGSTPGDAKVLRLLPPLTLSAGDVEVFVRALASVLRGS